MVCINTTSKEFLLHHKLLLNKLKKRVLQFLNLPDITLKYEHGYRSEYKWDHIALNYSYNSDLSNLNKLLKINMNTFEERLIFDLFHELGHHFHAIKYKKWTSHFVDKYNPRLYNINEYCNQRVEQVANNIAKILLKKYYPQGLSI